MELKEKMSEVVSSVIDNKNGTSTVIYKTGKRTRIEYLPTAQALLLAKRSKEAERAQMQYEGANGHALGDDEIYRKMLLEAETHRQITRKIARGEM